MSFKKELLDRFKKENSGVSGENVTTATGGSVKADASEKVGEEKSPEGLCGSYSSPDNGRKPGEDGSDEEKKLQKNPSNLHQDDVIKARKQQSSRKRGSGIKSDTLVTGGSMDNKSGVIKTSTESAKKQKVTNLKASFTLEETQSKPDGKVVDKSRRQQYSLKRDVGIKSQTPEMGASAVTNSGARKIATSKSPRERKATTLPEFVTWEDVVINPEDSETCSSEGSGSDSDYTPLVRSEDI